MDALRGGYRPGAGAPPGHRGHLGGGAAPGRGCPRNPVIRGWMQYYGAFYRTGLYPLLKRITCHLMRWVRKKYPRLKAFKEFHRRWKQVTTAYPLFFAHWKWVHSIW
ncbi:group II intron maturase-specific domain-containing protein [Streptomyces sp. NPDC007369]|uniref:group II intron maturase-specific domain-containing protein n=1 Tax=Streptomyces sp. NPDC007369 TaxID=3154589 RepID=UPI0033CFDAA4